MNRPLIGIPIGDPAGIGPEIVVKALKHKEIYSFCKPFVVGDEGIIRDIMSLVNPVLGLNLVKGPEEGKYEYGTIDAVSLDNVENGSIRPGEVQSAAGRAAYEYIVHAVELANNRRIDAVATTPINKEALKDANIEFIGHTEILAKLTNTYDPLTMFQVHNMRVFFLSRHVSLRKACDLVKKDRLVEYIARCSDALGSLGFQGGCMAVAGLNPHNGENGLFGDEEASEICPAIEEARKNGINVVGPIPADSVFFQALKGKFDAVLSLYHDQGHIATKTVDFERTISLTIGMPFLRTSVDHGTAFDIAGKGIASEISMVEAIKLAAEYGVMYTGRITTL